MCTHRFTLLSQRHGFDAQELLEADAVSLEAPANRHLCYLLLGSVAVHDHSGRNTLYGSASSWRTVVRDRIGKQSLDVGADRIARTAHAALQLLHELRGRLGKPIPLA